MDPERAAREGWSSYSPLDAEARPCSFCGRPQDEGLLVLHSADGSAAICEEWTSRFSEFFARRRRRDAT